MRVYLLSNEKLLIEIDGWGIIEQQAMVSPYMYASPYVYASHQCLLEIAADGDYSASEGMVYGEGCWTSRQPKTKCYHCHEPVPEGVQALVKLHEWEK